MTTFPTTTTRHGLNLEEGGLRHAWQLEAATEIVDRSGLAPALQYLADHDRDGCPRRGRKRSLGDIREILIAFLLNAMARHHHGRIIEVARVIHNLSDDAHETLGFEGYCVPQIEDHLYRFLKWLAGLLREGPSVLIAGQTMRLTTQTFTDRLLIASIELASWLPTLKAIALDDTAIETFAALYGDPADALVVEDDDGTGRPEHLRSSRPRGKRKLGVRYVDSAGRNVYTHDDDARGSYATATNSRAGHTFIGYHLFVVTLIKAFVRIHTDGQPIFGPAVPGLILGAALAPGGDHRGESILPVLEHVRRQWPDVDEVVLDNGYTRAKPERFFYPARRLGYDITFEPKQHQRGVRPFAGDAICVDGCFYSRLMPDHLIWDARKKRKEPLPFSPWHTPAATRLEEAELFDQRLPYLYRRKERPDRDGATRLLCPFCHGYTRSPQVPHSMRAGHGAPIVYLPGGDNQQCCTSSTITVSAKDGLYWQRVSFGGTAWRAVCLHRKNAVEGSNSLLKGQYITADGKFTNVMGLEKVMIFLTFAMAGHNADRIRAWEIKRSREAAASRTRKKQRTGTWHTDASTSTPT